MNEIKLFNQETVSVHSGEDQTKGPGRPLAPPIYQSTVCTSGGSGTYTGTPVLAR